MWLISILLIAMSLVLPEVRAEHPNVLLFLMDDIGADRFRFYGSNINYSPNLNEFAKTATRFDAFFTHPLCGPSRAALLSGRFSSNTGALNNGHRRNTYFDPSECTLGATFQHAGYDTAIFGKVHAAHRFFFQRGKWPAFDEVCGFNHWALWARSSPRYANSTILTNIGTGDLTFNNLVGVMKNPNVSSTEREYRAWNTYHPHLNRELAKAFITRATVTKKPFFLYLPMLLAHGPFEDNIRDPSLPSDMLTAPDGVSLFGQRQMLADAIIGDILRHLRVSGLESDTIVLVSSDNGTPRAYPSVVNGIVTRSGKRFAAHTKGTRVPLLIKDPRLTLQPSIITSVTHMHDILPTLVEATGIDGYPSGKDIPDGRSFWQMITGELQDWSRWALLFTDSRPPNGVIRNQQYILGTDGNVFYEEQWYNRVAIPPQIVCSQRFLLRKLRTLVHEAWKLDIHCKLPGSKDELCPWSCTRIECNSETDLPECIA